MNTAVYPRSSPSVAAISLTDVAAFISKRNYPTYAFKPGGGGGLPHETDGDARRKF